MRGKLKILTKISKSNSHGRTRNDFAGHFTVRTKVKKRRIKVHLKRLERTDVNSKVLKEWKKGRIIDSSDLERFLAREITIAVKRRDRIVGLVNVRESGLGKRKPEVVALETSPGARENFSGIGSGMMAAAILISKDWGYGGAVRLTSDSKAVGFYKKLGMRRYSGSNNEMYFSPSMANEFLMGYESESKFVPPIVSPQKDFLGFSGGQHWSLIRSS